MHLLTIAAIAMACLAGGIGYLVGAETGDDAETAQLTRFESAAIYTDTTLRTTGDELRSTRSSLRAARITRDGALVESVSLKRELDAAEDAVDRARTSWRETRAELRVSKRRLGNERADRRAASKRAHDLSDELAETRTALETAREAVGRAVEDLSAVKTDRDTAVERASQLARQLKAARQGATDPAS